MRGWSLALAAVTLAGLAAAGLVGAAAPAEAGVVGSSAANGDGTWTYSYTVDNTAGGFDVAVWSLEFDFAAPDWNQLEMASGGDVAVPTGWAADVGVPVVGQSAQDFVSLDPSGDVAVGATLAGFAFTSSFEPGTVRYLEFSGTADEADGTTVGPSAAPEPLGLAALASLALVARRAWR